MDQYTHRAVPKAESVRKTLQRHKYREMRGLHRYMTFFILFLMALNISAQNVSNVIATQVGKTIEVSYDLDQVADITLHISMDGGGTFRELQKVSGDVGKTVGPGQKTIVWNVMTELGELNGDDIVFKVEAQDIANDMNITVNGVTFKMIYVSGGTFTMGCTSEQGRYCEKDEIPSHKVTVSDFMIGETEVTQALWESVMGNNPSFFKGDNRPVEEVSWNECQKFIEKMNKLTGKTFRLPTEAEWEYAARGGNKSKGYKYSGSNIVDDVAWCSQSSIKKTHSVKMKSPNELGIFDMSGNVWEWCLDNYDLYSGSAQTNPNKHTSNSMYILRGGSWYSLDKYCRVTCRHCKFSYYRENNCGLRLVLVQ